MAVHFLVFLPISSRNSIQEYQIHYSKWDKHIQNVLQHCDDFQLFSESHNLAGCADSLLLLPRPPFVYKGFATTAPQQRHFLQRAHGLVCACVSEKDERQCWRYEGEKCPFPSTGFEPPPLRYAPTVLPITLRGQARLALVKTNTSDTHRPAPPWNNYAWNTLTPICELECPTMFDWR